MEWGVVFGKAVGDRGRVDLHVVVLARPAALCGVVAGGSRSTKKALRGGVVGVGRQPGDPARDARAGCCGLHARWSVHKALGA